MMGIGQLREVLVGTGSVEGGTGWYLVVLDQHGAKNCNKGKANPM